MAETSGNSGVPGGRRGNDRGRGNDRRGGNRRSDDRGRGHERRSDNRRGDRGRPGRGAPQDERIGKNLPRRIAWEVLLDVRDEGRLCEPAPARETRPHPSQRPGRRLHHRTDLRGAAAAEVLRRGHHDRRLPRHRRDRPRTPGRDASGRPPAAVDASPRPCGPVRDRRRRQALGGQDRGIRQCGAAPHLRSRSRRMARAGHRERLRDHTTGDRTLPPRMDRAGTDPSTQRPRMRCRRARSSAHRRQRSRQGRTPALCPDSSTAPNCPATRPSCHRSA